jgi:glycine/D-amino acid oxidase-like deaminating enzyme
MFIPWFPDTLLAAMRYNEQPVWLEGVRFPAGDPGPLPERADVVIIGGGLTGLAAARALARRGADVALLEAQTLGWGASSRNGGMVLTGLKLGAAALRATYGLERARAMFAASLEAIACVEQLVREERIDCDFARHGHLLLAAKRGHARALAAEAALLAREFGHPTRFLPAAELPGEIGSARFFAGLVDEASAGLNPARYTAGLAQAASRAGARLFSDTPASRIQRERGVAAHPFVVTTARGALRAGAVLVATGGYTGAATPALRRRIVPLGSYIVATEPLPADLARALIPRGRMVFDSLHLLHYFRLTPDNRLLFGGRAAFLPETGATVRESAAILQRAMAAIFPQVRDTRIEYAWGGTLDVPFDLMPHVGQRDDVYFALGYAGHGVALATWLGTRLAERISRAGGETPFDGLPFPGAPLGLYNGWPWFLPLAGLYYRALDWLR